MALCIYSFAAFHEVPKTTWVLVSAGMWICHILGVMMGALIKATPIEHVMFEDLPE